MKTMITAIISAIALSAFAAGETVETSSIARNWAMQRMWDKQREVASLKGKAVDLNELGHSKGRSRWTWAQGNDAAARLEAAGTQAVVPCWGDRII